MARGACSFRERDVRTAVKAVRRAGLKVERVEVEPSGKITVMISGEAGGEELAVTDFDKWKVSRARQA
jgi:hypothetical protein